MSTDLPVNDPTNPAHRLADDLRNGRIPGYAADDVRAVLTMLAASPQGEGEWITHDGGPNPVPTEAANRLMAYVEARRIKFKRDDGCSEKPVLSDRREMAKGVAPRTDPVLVLRETCQRLLDDYQTSEAHHPNHVLVLKADFEALRKAADGCSSNEGAE